MAFPTQSKILANLIIYYIASNIQNLLKINSPTQLRALYQAVKENICSEKIDLQDQDVMTAAVIGIIKSNSLLPRDSVGQNKVIKATKSYAKVVGEINQGKCFGLSIAHILDKCFLDESWWENNLTVLVNWDGSYDRLLQNELAPIFLRILKELDLYQSMDENIWEIGNKLQVVKASNESGAIEPLILAGYFDLEELLALLPETSSEGDIPPCLVENDKHACNFLYDVKSAKYIFYDSNEGEVICDSKEILANKIVFTLGSVLTLIYMPTDESQQNCLSDIKDEYEKLLKNPKILQPEYSSSGVISGLAQLFAGCPKKLEEILETIKTDEDMYRQFIDSLSVSLHKMYCYPSRGELLKQLFILAKEQPDIKDIILGGLGLQDKDGFTELHLIIDKYKELLPLLLDLVKTKKDIMRLIESLIAMFGVEKTAKQTSILMSLLLKLLDLIKATKDRKTFQILASKFAKIFMYVNVRDALHLFVQESSKMLEKMLEIARENEDLLVVLFNVLLLRDKDNQTILLLVVTMYHDLLSQLLDLAKTTKNEKLFQQLVAPLAKALILPNDSGYAALPFIAQISLKILEDLLELAKKSEELLIAIFRGLSLKNIPGQTVLSVIGATDSKLLSKLLAQITDTKRPSTAKQLILLLRQALVLSDFEKSNALILMAKELSQLEASSKASLNVTKRKENVENANVLLDKTSQSNQNQISSCKAASSSSFATSHSSVALSSSFFKTHKSEIPSSHAISTAGHSDATIRASLSTA